MTILEIDKVWDCGCTLYRYGVDLYGSIKSDSEGYYEDIRHKEQLDLLNDTQQTNQSYQPLTKERLTQLVNMMKRGVDKTEIAKLLNVSQETVDTAISVTPSLNPRRFEDKFTQEFKEAIINDYTNSNMKYNDICKKYGISTASMSIVLKEANISFRGSRNGNKVKAENKYKDIKDSVALALIEGRTTYARVAMDYGMSYVVAKRYVDDYLDRHPELDRRRRESN